MRAITFPCSPPHNRLVLQNNPYGTRCLDGTSEDGTSRTQYCLCCHLVQYSPKALKSHHTCHRGIFAYGPIELALRWKIKRQACHSDPFITRSTIFVSLLFGQRGLSMTPQYHDTMEASVIYSWSWLEVNLHLPHTTMHGQLYVSTN